MKDLDQNKLYTAMRSIYRFSEFKNIGAPEILINTERDILHQYLSELTAEEILYIIANFANFQQEQNLQAQVENEQMIEALAKLN